MGLAAALLLLNGERGRAQQAALRPDLPPRRRLTDLFASSSLRWQRAASRMADSLSSLASLNCASRPRTMAFSSAVFSCTAISLSRGGGGRGGGGGMCVRVCL